VNCAVNLREKITFGVKNLELDKHAKNMSKI